MFILNNTIIIWDGIIYVEYFALFIDIVIRILANPVKFDMVTMAAPNKGYMPRQYFKQVFFSGHRIQININII